jgi:hypothetical protein
LRPSARRQHYRRRAQDVVKQIHLQSIDPHRIVMKQPALLVRRAIGNGGEEALIDRIERAGEPIRFLAAGFALEQFQRA